MANIIYNSAKKKLIDGSIDLDSDTIKVALCTSSYTPNADTHDFFDDISGELTVSGYTTGGETLANKTITVDNTNDWAYLDGDDLVFASLAAGETIAWAIIYKSTGAAATSALIAALDVNDTATSGGNVTLVWSSSGILRIA